VLEYLNAAARQFACFFGVTPALGPDGTPGWLGLSITAVTGRKTLSLAELRTLQELGWYRYGVSRCRGRV